MPVLTRKVGERIMIGDNIVVTVTKVSRNQAGLGIEPPKDAPVVRQELQSRPAKQPKRQKPPHQR